MNANYASDRQTYHHLNGMKGIACFFVLVGHYLGIYKYSQSFIPSICCFDIINDSHFAIFLDEGYWLYLFFVISGYLVSRSNIYNIKELLCRIVIRFFRLACPILFSHFIIYFIYRTVGFHNGETTTLFQCEWFQQIFYTRDFTIKDVLISPFSVLIFGNSDMNKPYWVLQMMFFSSIVIYLIVFCFMKLDFWQREIFVCVLLIAVISLSFIFPIISAHLIGMLAAFYEKHDFNCQSSYLFWVIITAMLIVILPDKILASVSFAILVVLTPRVKVINDFFCRKLCRFLGSISWEIYSFHWPIVCSFGALWLVNESNRIGLVEAYLCGFFIAVVIIVTLSWCFNKTLGKLAAILIRKLYVFLHC